MDAVATPTPCRESERERESGQRGESCGAFFKRVAERSLPRGVGCPSWAPSAQGTTTPRSRRPHGPPRPHCFLGFLWASMTALAAVVRWLMKSTTSLSPRRWALTKRDRYVFGPHLSEPLLCSWSLGVESCLGHDPFWQPWTGTSGFSLSA